MTEHTLQLIQGGKFEPLKLTGVGRDLDAPGGALTFYFDRQPTNAEMRFLHDCMTRSVALMPDDLRGQS